MPKAKVNYALAATLLGAGMHPDEIAPKVGAKNGNTVSAGLCRKGVNATLARSPNLVNRVNMSLTAKIASEAGEILRNTLSDTLDKHSQALAKVPAKVNLKHIRAVGEAMEPLVRSAKIVHDWGNEQSLGIVALGIVEHLDQAQDALEVQSSVVPTTTESVQPESPLDQNTQG